MPSKRSSSASSSSCLPATRVQSHRARANLRDQSAGTHGAAIRDVALDKRSACFFGVDDAGIKQIQTAWKARNTGVELIVLQTPYRTIVAPLMEYIDVVKRERITDRVTVIPPEFVPRCWWHHLLRNPTALLLNGALLFRKDVIVTTCPATWIGNRPGCPSRMQRILTTAVRGGRTARRSRPRRLRRPQD